MRRRQLMEIAEQPGCPRAVREGVVEYLQFAIEVGKVYAPVTSRLAAAIGSAGAGRVIDLCAGAGGPWRSMQPALTAAGTTVRVRLTDKFPNVAGLRRAALAAGTSGTLEVDPRQVDAAHVPADLRGFRTIFSAFHHFEPIRARAILYDAASRNEGIAVVEATRRSVGAILLMLLAPLFVLVATPFIRPFRWSRLFWTYVLPAIPLAVLVDGIVSCLRTYTADELRAMTEGLGPDEYTWEVGEVPGRGPLPLTYVIGHPAVAPMRRAVGDTRALSSGTEGIRLASVALPGR